MILFMVVGVVDQYVEYHTPEQLLHVLRVELALHDTFSPEQLCQLRVAETVRRSLEGDFCGQAVKAPAAGAIEAPDRNRVPVGQTYRHRLCDTDRGPACQGH